MKILIIGGTGNISWHCVNALISQGHDICVLNRNQTLKTRRKVAQEINSVIMDINDIMAVNQLLDKERFDVIVDFLCYTPVDAKRDLALFSGRCRQFIYCSSAAVYKRKNENQSITEERMLDAEGWEYSQNKIFCEEIFLEAYRKDQFPITIIRPGHTYDTLIPEAVGFGDWTIAQRILQNKPVVVHDKGNSLWTLTHSMDFASAFIGIVGECSSIGEAYHITSNEVLTWNDIMFVLAKALGKDSPNIKYVPTEKILLANYNLGISLIGHKKWNDIYNNNKIKKINPLWKPQILFEKGIKMSIDWLLENPDRQRINVNLDKIIDELCSL